MKVSPSDFSDQAVKAIREGKEILDPVLNQYGFTFEMGQSGKGSGGHFATAAYVAENRRIEFSYRWALGSVTYVTPDFQMGHSRFIELIGKRFDSEYVRFDRENPLSGFIALRHDLEHFVRDFLEGDLSRMEAIAQAGRNPNND